MVVFKVFAIAGFWYFEALDGHLGLILAPLGPKFSKMGPQNGSQRRPKSSPKLVQQMTTHITKNELILGPEMDPEISKAGEVWVRRFQDGGF